MITAAQIEAGYIKGRLGTDCIQLFGTDEESPAIHMRAPNGETELTIWPYSEDTVEFAANDMLQPANIRCGLVNGRNISNLADENHDHHGVYVENGGNQNLRLQVFNGKLEIRDSGDLIGTITLD